MPKCILTEQGGRGSGSGIVLSTLEVKTNPTKTSYLSGDTVNLAGLVLTAHYTMSGVEITTKDITYVGDGTDGITYSPSVLDDTHKTVTVQYSDSNGSATVGITMTVTAIPVSMVISTAPTATQTYLGTISNTGVVATVTYSDGSTPTKSASALTRTAPTGTTWSTVGTQQMTFSFTENGKTVSASCNVTVNKAAQSISFNPTSVAINASNYSAGVSTTMTYRGNGTVTIQNGTTTGLSGTVGTPSATATGTGSTVAITMKGNGTTAVSARTITIQVAESTYFLAGTGTFTASAEYWSFGNGTGEAADAAWFAGLKNYLANSAPSSDWVGKEKTVTLTSAVLGTTSHKVRVIGINQDGNRTVTFQTSNCLGQTTVYNTASWSSTNDDGARWTSTTCAARLRCEDYYNAFPGKASIKTVKKGWCYNTDQSRSQTTVTYTDMTVFLPSEREMGLDSYAPITVANSTTSNAECCQGYNASYSYYTDNAKRIKYLGDSGTSGQYYWERSRYSGSSSNYRGYVCYVYNNGTADYTNYGTSLGLAPAFVIGN